MELEELRRQIDAVDDDMVRLLVSRIEIVERIRALKEGMGIPLEDLSREAYVVNRLSAGLPDSMKPCVASLYAALFEISKMNHQSQSNTQDTMAKYVCDLCGYEYDPATGDPDNGVAPGTAFENIPADWVCPLCGAGKEDFSPVK